MALSLDGKPKNRYKDNDELLLKQILLDLEMNPEGVVSGLTNDGQRIEVRYVTQAGYKLRVYDKFILETTDVDVVVEIFSSWGKRKKDWHQTKNLLNVRNSIGNKKTSIDSIITWNRMNVSLLCFHAWK